MIVVYCLRSRLHFTYFVQRFEHYFDLGLGRVFVTTSFHLGIEFYLFVSHGGMNYRESTCKFRIARSAFRNLHVDPLSFIPP